MFSVQGGWNQFILSNSRFRSSLLHYKDLKAQLPVFVVRQEPPIMNVEGFVLFCFKSIWEFACNHFGTMTTFLSALNISRWWPGTQTQNQSFSHSDVHAQMSTQKKQTFAAWDELQHGMNGGTCALTPWQKTTGAAWRRTSGIAREKGLSDWKSPHTLGYSSP